MHYHEEILDQWGIFGAYEQPAALLCWTAGLREFTRAGGEPALWVIGLSCLKRYGTWTFGL